MKYDNTINLISRIRELSGSVIVSELEKAGIKGVVPSHGDIIVALIKHRELTMTEIAEGINKDRSTVTTLVKKLNKLGFTDTKKNELDQRSSLVFLTPKGRELEKGFEEISEKLYSIQYEGITDEEREVFRRVLIKMHENFNRRVL